MAVIRREFSKKAYILFSPHLQIGASHVHNNTSLQGSGVPEPGPPVMRCQWQLASGYLPKEETAARSCCFARNRSIDLPLYSLRGHLAYACHVRHILTMAPATESSLKWPFAIGALCVVGFLVFLGGVGRSKAPPVPKNLKVRNFWDPSKPLGTVITVEQPGPIRPGRPKRQLHADQPSTSSAVDDGIIDLEAGIRKYDFTTV
jgi:hypothetical protein